MNHLYSRNKKRADNDASIYNNALCSRKKNYKIYFQKFKRNILILQDKGYSLYSISEEKGIQLST